MNIWRRIFDERKRAVLPLVLILAANVAVLVLAVLPLRAAVASAERSSIDAMAALADARRQEKRASDAKASQGRADTELKKFYTDVLPRDFANAQRTANLWLSQAARDAGLTFKGSQFDWEEVTESSLLRAFARVTLEGRYANIRRFLYAVETAQEFIVVESVELAGETSSPSEMLRVSLLVSTYFMPPAAPRP